MLDICCELVMALIFSRILQSLRSPIDTIIDAWDAGRSEDVFFKICGDRKRVLTDLMMC
jgi:hypothetical protein